MGLSQIKYLHDGWYAVMTGRWGIKGRFWMKSLEFLIITGDLLGEVGFF